MCEVKRRSTLVAEDLPGLQVAWGARRGASEWRLTAIPGDGQPTKLLVEQHLAALSHTLKLHGMQEVRGSTPLSSTQVRVYFDLVMDHPSEPYSTKVQQ
jgi:hypothetical protein